jgi:hypothetical protein
MGHGGRLDRLPRWNNPAIDSEREETITARRAAIGGSAQQAKYPRKRSHSVLTGNALQVHVAAHPAMHVPDVVKGGRPRVEAGGARLAPPGTHPGDSHKVIFCAAPAGTARTIAMTERAEQAALPLANLRLRIRTSLPHGKPRGRPVPQVAMNRIETAGGGANRTGASGATIQGVPPSP